MLMTGFQNKSRHCFSPWWRGRTGDWASRGSVLAAALGHTDDKPHRGLFAVCSEYLIGVLIDGREDSQRCPCPCWAAPAAGVGVRREDASACLQLWSGRRPAGTDQEGSSTDLPSKYLRQRCFTRKQTVEFNLTWWLTPQGSI